MGNSAMEEDQQKKSKETLKDLRRFKPSRIRSKETLKDLRSPSSYLPTGIYYTGLVPPRNSFELNPPVQRWLKQSGSSLN